MSDLNEISRRLANLAEFSQRSADIEYQALSPEERRERFRKIVFCTRELSGGIDHALIHPMLLERLAGYRDHGYPVGDFLQAVIANDLVDAFARGDEYNLASLRHLIAWMYNEFPGPLWGSREKYAAHVERKRKERELREANPGLTIRVTEERRS